MQAVWAGHVLEQQTKGFRTREQMKLDYWTKRMRALTLVPRMTARGEPPHLKDHDKSQ